MTYIITNPSLTLLPQGRLVKLLGFGKILLWTLGFTERKNLVSLVMISHKFLTLQVNAVHHLLIEELTRYSTSPDTWLH